MRNLIEPATFLAKYWRHRKRNTFSTKTVSTGGLDHDVSEIRNGGQCKWVQINANAVWWIISSMQCRKCKFVLVKGVNNAANV